MDRVGGHLAALQRQEHAGGEERIEERERVADQAEAVAADLLGVIRVLAGHAHRLHLLADRDALADPGAGVDLAAGRSRPDRACPGTDSPARRRRRR